MPAKTIELVLAIESTTKATEGLQRVRLGERRDFSTGRVARVSRSRHKSSVGAPYIYSAPTELGVYY
jgi:hypothetical protein